MANHNGPIVRGNTFVPIFEDRHNKALRLKLREAMLYNQIEKLVEMRNEDKFSHFKDLSLVTFNIFGFPISKLINPTLNIFQREKYHP